MDNWIELENGYLTNQPTIRSGRKTVPDPDVEPTEAWLFCYRCTRTPKKRRVRRKRYLHVLSGKNQDDLNSQIESFVNREDVILIADQDRSGQYISSGIEPVSLQI